MEQDYVGYTNEEIAADQGRQWEQPAQHDGQSKVDAAISEDKPLSEKDAQFKQLLNFGNNMLGTMQDKEPSEDKHRDAQHAIDSYEYFFGKDVDDTSELIRNAVNKEPVYYGDIEQRERMIEVRNKDGVVVGWMFKHDTNDSQEQLRSMVEKSSEATDLLHETQDQLLLYKGRYYTALAIITGQILYHFLNYINQ